MSFQDTTNPRDEVGVALAVTYHFVVETDDTRLTPRHRRRYCGTDPADAMAEWSKAVSRGVAYVTLEALRDRPPASSSTLTEEKQ